MQTPPLPPEFEKILMRVLGPGQYVGGEVNSIVKESPALRVALAFPDAYAVGMSHLGMQILYDIINRRDGWAAERCFAPWPDMENELRAANLKLGTLETNTPLGECDAVGFSLTYELGATCMLTMLDLGGVPVLASERGAGVPLVLAGGHAAFNPEPLANFVDAFIIGDGEEALPEALAVIREMGGRSAPDRQAVLRRLAEEVAGVYVPAFMELEENADGFLAPVRAAAGAFPVRRRTVDDLANVPVLTKPIVPTFQTAHERVTLEIMRGCPNGCRFCQAGFICRPVRQRPVTQLVAAAKECYKNTGYDEIGLLSLSTSNYGKFDELVSELDRHFAPLGVSLSLPSLRVDHALSGIPEKFRTVRKSGFTIAPEAGSDRLRRIINKDVTNENLIEAATQAYAQGWQAIKLYFMVGLPGETDEDAVEIGRLATRVALERRKGPKRKPAATLSASNFVPKPHTPFQWEAMAAPEVLARRQRLVGDSTDRRKVSYKSHDLRTSLLEGVMARGDRRLGKVVLAVWQAGARFDGWSEHFRYSLWEQAFADHGIDPLRYACKERSLDEPNPWAGVDLGISTEFLKRERENAFAETTTPMCAADHCAGCGLERCGMRDGE